MKEEWKDVTGYEESYEISNVGRVRTKLRIRRNRSGWKKWPPKFLKPWRIGKCGHLFVRLYDPPNKPKTESVHRLVLMHFVGPCPEGMQCCHNDGDVNNNCVTNLRWDTPKANSEDRTKHGRHWTEKGTQRYNAKLNEDKVRDIRKRYADGGATLQELADEYGVTFGLISHVINRISWKHVE